MRKAKEVHDALALRDSALMPEPSEPFTRRLVMSLALIWSSRVPSKGDTERQVDGLSFLRLGGRRNKRNPWVVEENEMNGRRCLRIARRLTVRGVAVLDAGRKMNPFTNNEDADRILNNIESYPHVFVLGCIADRQMPSEASWYAAYEWCRLVVPEGPLTFRRMWNSIQRQKSRIRVNCRYPITTSHFYAAVSKIHAPTQATPSRYGKVGLPQSP